MLSSSAPAGFRGYGHISCVSITEGNENIENLSNDIREVRALVIDAIKGNQPPSD